MPRIEIELTSARPDGTWTWRAAGARQPKGVLDGGLLPDGTQQGDVLRADVEVDVDGMTVVAVLPPKTKRPEPDRLELVGPPPRPALSPARSESPQARPPRRDQPADRESRARPERGEARGPREPREPRQPRDTRAPREGRRRIQPTPTASPPRPKPRRLQPGRAHRNAAVAELPPAHQPVAEQVLRGGLAAVRQAVDQENERAVSEGLPPIKADALVALAEELLPRLRAAEWRDRADAALQDVETVGLRDLRSLVAAAEVTARDEEGRAIGQQLREALDRRSAAERERWLGDIGAALDDGRVVRALRISARAPEPGTRLPADLSTRLCDAAGAALAPDVAPDRWAAVLEAVAVSPVRRDVKPAGLPPEPGTALLAAATQAAGRVPALASLPGIEVPKVEGRSTPPPRRPAGPSQRPRPAPSPEPAPKGSPDRAVADTG